MYIRVSTVDQNHDLQRRELLEFAKLRAWNIVQIYEDTASGTNSNRQALKKCLADVRQRKFDIFLCWKLDRVARSLKDLIGIIEELTELNVAFVSKSDSIDLSTSAGRLMLGVLGSFAQFEADLISERTRSGMAAARKRGSIIGRPKLKGTENVMRLHSTGLTSRKIASELGISKTSVLRILAGPKGSKNKQRKAE